MLKKKCAVLLMLFEYEIATFHPVIYSTIGITEVVYFK